MPQPGRGPWRSKSGKFTYKPPPPPGTLIAFSALLHQCKVAELGGFGIISELSSIQIVVAVDALWQQINNFKPIIVGIRFSSQSSPLYFYLHSEFVVIFAHLLFGPNIHNNSNFLLSLASPPLPARRLARFWPRPQQSRPRKWCLFDFGGAFELLEGKNQERCS